MFARRRRRRADRSERRARAEIYKELIEINTTDTPAGNVTKAAEAMAARLKAAGLPRRRHAGARSRSARRAISSSRYRGTGARKPLLLLAHLDVVEAKREDWSIDPFTFVEKDGFFYGRGTSDDKAMASQFVANLIRLKEEGFTPDRDLILALTADEEGGNFNGVDWLVKNHRDLIDAEFAINEGGGGTMRKGKYLTNEVQASEKVFQDFRLEVTNAGRPQLAAGEGQRDLSPGRGPGAAGGVRLPGRAERGDARLLRSARPTSRPIRSSPPTCARWRGRRPISRRRRGCRRRCPYYNAMMRTTCVATRLLGGHANNALPQLATANVNCRILPGVSPASVKDKLVEVLADPKIKVDVRRTRRTRASRRRCAPTS